MSWKVIPIYSSDPAAEPGFILDVDGLKYSSAIFKFFKEDANRGTHFKFINNEDGVVTVETIREELPHA